MDNQKLATELLDVANLFVQAAHVLKADDTELYITIYGKALRALDNYQDAASSASVN